MIWGCDLGSRKVAVSCPERGYTAAIELPRVRAHEVEDRLGDLDRLASFVASHVPEQEPLWIEKPVPNHKVSLLTCIHLGMVVGAIAGRRSGPSFLVLPHVWKKEVLGVGNAGKPAIREWLEASYPALAEACQDNQDLVDATCVGLFGGSPAAAELERAWRLQRVARA